MVAMNGVRLVLVCFSLDILYVLQSTCSRYVCVGILVCVGRLMPTVFDTYFILSCGVGR